MEMDEVREGRRMMNTTLQTWASERRERFSPLEMAVKALGAKYPVIVAAQIDPGCRDVPAAVAALRQRAPHWFERTAATSVAAAAPENSMAPLYPESLAIR